ncbi:MAG: hypothetical protein RI890_524 [Actinomycetota bacterium]
MADITLPQLGETVTEGTITRWFKKVGDAVAADEPLFEEVPSPVAGTLTEIRVKEGDTVPVGTVIAVVGAASGASVQPAPAPAPAPVAQPAPAPVAQPAPATAPSPAPVMQPVAASVATATRTRVLRLQLALRFRRVFQTSCFRQLCVALFLNMALMSTHWLALVQVVVLPVKMF